MVNTSLTTMNNSLCTSCLRDVTPDGFGVVRSISVLVVIMLNKVNDVAKSMVTTVILNKVSAVLRDFNSLQVIVCTIVLVIVVVTGPDKLVNQRRFSVNG